MQSNPQLSLRDQEGGLIGVEPKSRPKQAIAIPVGKGYRIHLESRFITVLFVGIFVNLLGALCNNEWLYLLSSSYISAAVLGAIIPLLLLMTIEFQYALPEEILSSDKALVIVKLKRSKFLGILSQVVPVRWLRLNVDAARRGKDGTTFEPIFPPEPVLIESLETERWFEFPTPHLERGVYKFFGIELSTCFPLGIVWWTRKINLQDKRNVLITVYPRHFPISGNFLEHLRGVSSTMGLASALSAVTHQSTSFRSVREFRTGDTLRHIHWAMTAKAGEILVKEFDQETLPVFNLLFNLRANWQSKEQFELAVTAALSLCHLGYSMGQLPNLILNPPINSKVMKDLMGDLPVGINPGLEKYSEILARVEPVSLRARGADTSEENLIAEELDDHEFHDRDLLTLLPTAEKVMKYTPGVGDVICNPIELAIVPQGWEYEGEDFDSGKKDIASLIKFDKLRPGKSKESSVKKAMGPTYGEVIGRIEWVKDLEAL